MADIAIAKVKAWREQIDATHLVVFAVSEDGTLNVATHGKTEDNAKEAAAAGNKLKSALGWPGDLCRALPLERKCKNCTFYEPDRGIRCFNGWSADGSRGQCLYEPSRVQTAADSKCSKFEPKASL